MKTFLLMALAFVFALNSGAQNLKKGFKYLQDKDFDRAKVIFDQSVNENSLSCFSFYGNALIYKDKAYRAHDLYRAFESAKKAVEFLPTADEAMWSKLSDYITDKEQVKKLLDEIDNLLYLQVKNENTIPASERFLKEATGSAYYKAVGAIYSNQRFQQAQEFNTIMAYEDFIKEFPEALEVPSATQKIYSLAYQQVVKADKLADYQEFIADYPNSPQVEGAKVKIMEKEYEMVLLTGTDDAYERFIKKYPGTSQSGELRKKQIQINYVQARQLNSVNVYNNFLKKFPESALVPEITTIRDSLAYLEAKSINTTQAYKDFISKYPNAPQVSRVMALQQSLNYSKAELAVLKSRQVFSSKNVRKAQFYKVDPVDSTKRTLVKTVVYDVFGNEVEISETTTVGSKVDLKRVYNSAGNLMIQEHKLVDGNDRYLRKYYFNENDLLDSARIICYQPCEDGLPQGTFKAVYSYFPDRNLKECKIQGDNYSKSATYIINNQKLVSQEFIKITEYEKVTELKVNYQYDFYDRLIQKSTFSGENTISAVETFFYNKAGDITKYSAYDALGKIRKSNKYDAYNMLMRSEVEFPNSPSNNHVLVCEYHYDN